MLTKTEADAARIYELEIQNAKLRSELEAARKVADAVVTWEILSSINDKYWSLRFRLLYPPGQSFVDLDDALALIDGIGRQVIEEKDAALAEYRALAESLSPEKQGR